MKKISSIIIAVAAIFAAGCNDNIPKIGDYNSARVKEVVFDEVLTNGLDIDLGATFSLPSHISYLPADATNTAQRYDTSDDSVASISEQGVLTAAGVGNATVTVYIGTEGVFGEFEVRVTEPVGIAITSLKFNSESAEYEFSEASINLKRILRVGSASLTEEATERIVWTSSDESVATVDQSGLVTANKVGSVTITAAAAVSDVEPASIVLNFFRWVEYERFPGDLDGQPREIMGSSAAEWNALPHTDGGWDMVEFGWLEDASQKDKWNSTVVQRNPYRYAMIDGRKIENRSGAANNLPTATNGTAFCWQRPGGKKQSVEKDGVYIIIDMKKSQRVQYFRTVNISDHADDRGVRVTRVSELQGSNDGSTWETIASGLEGWNPREFNGVTEYHLESLKATFDNDKDYRYIKFILKKQDRCYGYFVNPSDANSDRDGNAMQVAELYMGYKSYSE